MKRRVYLLYEYDVAFSPHASAYLRLIRPLTYPSLRATVETKLGLHYQQEDADVVIFDRFWRPDVTCDKVMRAVDIARRAGAKVVYAIDDDLLNIPTRATQVGSDIVRWPTENHREAMTFLLGEADSVWVTTEPLRDQYSSFNSSIKVLPNCLDERLLVRPTSFADCLGNQMKVIGYMGTPTHDDDLKMVIPALREICDRHRGAVTIEIVGGIADMGTRELLHDLPVRFLSPLPVDHEYPYFMMWFTRSMRWDVAIAPLRDTSFNRCKSDMKLLDYAAIGAVPVCSRAPAYEHTLMDRHTGLLVEDDPGAWIDALDELLRNDALCRTLATEATRYLQSQRTLSAKASSWLSALEDVYTDKDKI